MRRLVALLLAVALGGCNISDRQHVEESPRPEEPRTAEPPDGLHKLIATLLEAFAEKNT